MVQVVLVHHDDLAAGPASRPARSRPGVSGLWIDKEDLIRSCPRGDPEHAFFRGPGRLRRDVDPNW